MVGATGIWADYPLYPNERNVLVAQVQVGRGQRRHIIGTLGAWTIDQARARPKAIIQDPPPRSAIPKRGTLCVVERRHTSMRLHPPGRQEWFEFLPAIVRSVNRDGIIKEVECGPCRWQQDRVAGFARSWKTDLPGSLIETLGVRGWQSLDEATAAVRAAAGLTQPAATSVPQPAKAVPFPRQRRDSASDRAEDLRAKFRVVETAPSDDNGTVAKPQPPRRRRNSDVRPREHLTPDEIDRLLKAARKRGRYGQRDAAMILLAYRHGLRVSELVGLRWRDVDLDHGRIFVRRLKGSESSAHPLQGDEIRALRQVRREWGDASGFVFITERNGPMTAAGFRKLLSRLGSETGLGALAHPHALRHACGFALIDRGADVRVVQAWLGHRDISTTTRYTAVSARRLEGLWG